MAIRNTRLILKNSDIVNRPLPVSLLKGEAIVNTADGIVFFSGITTSTSEWTPAGTGSTATFFEVGSNLYDLRLRNQITQYQGQSGGSLSGKFLSGTTNGFVLADIADIAASIDSFTTGATWSPNTLTISLNNGKPNVPVTIDTFNGITLYGTNNVNGDLIVTGTTTLNGPAYYNNTASASNEIVNYGLLTAFSQTNDVYVTGNTLTPSTNDTPTQSAQLDYHGTPIGGPHFITTQDTFTTGGTYNNSNKLITFIKNDSTSYTVDLSTIDTNDTYVTGGTNNASTNNTSSASIDLLYNQDITPGTYSLPYTDVYTTGGTWNSGSTSIDFTRNDGGTYSVNLSNIDINDTYVTGGTVTSLGDLDLFRNDGVTVTVPKVTYWTSGSTGSFSIKAINGSGLDSTGDRSVSWGNQTLASGNDSTSWGYQTSATTVGSTASGYQTTASGPYSHAEGKTTTASGYGAHAEGVGTTASGYYSHAEGEGTKATGRASHSEGYQTTASNYGSHAEGQSTIASGEYSHAEGYLTMSIGNVSHAEGHQTSATTIYSHAEGSGTTATGIASHAEGGLTLASNTYSHSEGIRTTASGRYSHSEGYQTVASAASSHAEGGQSVASGFGSHAEGLLTTASGNYSHTEGNTTRATTTYAHAEGSNTVASGLGSHAEGLSTSATTSYAHAEGFKTLASGTFSHAQGSGTTASGSASFASGIGSRATSTGSFVHSLNSIVSGTRSVVLGGENITGSTNDTVYVPYLNLNYVPTSNDSNTQILSRNASTGQVEYTSLSAFTSLDTFVTGFTYNPANNTFTVSQNQGQPDLTASIDTVSGLTISNLTAGRVVYVGTGGLLTDEAGFEYNDGTNLLTVGNINVQNASGTTANIGQGGLVIGSGGSFTSPGIGDLTVHGDFTVFGTTTTVATSELYIEDPQITLNYNPTGSTTVTSVSSGLRIQDGNGVTSGDTYFTIGQMQNLTGIVVGENPDVTEYTGLTGYSNRGWVTQLNDIVIRNNNLNEGSPNGVRVLTEWDILDGGFY